MEKVKFTKDGQVKLIKSNRLSQIKTLEDAGWKSAEVKKDEIKEEKPTKTKKGE